MDAKRAVIRWILISHKRDGVDRSLVFGNPFLPFIRQWKKKKIKLKTKKFYVWIYKHLFSKCCWNRKARPTNYVWKLLNTNNQKKLSDLRHRGHGTTWMIKIWFFYRIRWKNRWGGGIKENQMNLGKIIQPKLLLLGREGILGICQL